MEFESRDLSGEGAGRRREIVGVIPRQAPHLKFLDEYHPEAPKSIVEKYLAAARTQRLGTACVLIGRESAEAMSRYCLRGLGKIPRRGAACVPVGGVARGSAGARAVGCAGHREAALRPGLDYFSGDDSGRLRVIGDGVWMPDTAQDERDRNEHGHCRTQGGICSSSRSGSGPRARNGCIPVGAVPVHDVWALSAYW